jgi:hypothetical protein
MMWSAGRGVVFRSGRGTAPRRKRPREKGAAVGRSAAARERTGSAPWRPELCGLCSWTTGLHGQPRVRHGGQGRIRPPLPLGSGEGRASPSGSVGDILILARRGRRRSKERARKGRGPRGKRRATPDGERGRLVYSAERLLQDSVRAILEREMAKLLDYVFQMFYGQI